MAGIRIKDYAVTAITVAADDYSDADSATLGTRKILCTVQATQYGAQLATDGMIFAAGTAAAPVLAIGTAGNGIYASAANTLDFTTAGAQKWQITSAGILQSPGAGTIGTATGALTIQTAGGNGNIRIQPNGTGKSGANITTPVTEWHVGSTSTATPRGIMSAQYTTDALGARIHMRKTRGTEGSPTIVVTGDDIGRLQWAGYDGAAYQEMASIRAAVTGTVAAGRVPTQLIFSTATDAATSVLTDCMWITSGQAFGFGIAAPGKRVDITDPTGQCLRLSYNGSAVNKVDFTVSIGGNLTIAPSGTTVTVSGLLAPTTLTASGEIDAGAASGFYMTGRSGMTSPADGKINFRDFNNTGAMLVSIGGTTSSFPALKRSSTSIAFRLADDSADAPITASNGTFSGNIIASGATSVIRLKAYTVATLPAGTQGDTAFCTDLLTPTFLTAAVGGGAVVGTVFFNGSSWISQ